MISNPANPPEFEKLTYLKTERKVADQDHACKALRSVSFQVFKSPFPIILNRMKRTAPRTVAAPGSFLAVQIFLDHEWSASAHGTAGG